MRYYRGRISGLVDSTLLGYLYSPQSFWIPKGCHKVYGVGPEAKMVAIAQTPGEPGRRVYGEPKGDES